MRGELLARLGRGAEAADEFDRAAQMTDNDREREVLTDKAAQARRRLVPGTPVRAATDVGGAGVEHRNDDIAVAVAAERDQSGLAG